MRKIGIITLYDPDNYGNRLQAYALSKTLQKLGCETAEVYHCTDRISKVKGFIKTNRLPRRVLELFLSIAVRDKGGIRNYRRVGLFFDFMKKGQMKPIPSNDPSIDYFVCGSDQVWNPRCGGTPFYFASFAPKEKRISYAASFGVGVLPDHVKQAYRSYLKDMAHISVREHAGADLVRELADRDVPVVLDPTLLLKRDEWQVMTKKPKFPVKERYVLTYFLGWHGDAEDRYIRKVAQEHDLQIIALNNMHKDAQWFGTGPAEFLWLIEHASLVCTNSFHATVFSIIMNTPFINFKRDSGKADDMNSRMDTLLGTLKLSDRVYGKVHEQCLWDVDFSHVADILEREKVHSVAYLKKALQLDAETFT